MDHQTLSEKLRKFVARQQPPGPELVGSATMLHQPPGIEQEVAAARGDQGGCTSKPPCTFARFALSAPAVEAGPIGIDVGGSEDSGAPVSHHPLAAVMHRVVGARA